MHPLTEYGIIEDTDFSLSFYKPVCMYIITYNYYDRTVKLAEFRLRLSLVDDKKQFNWLCD